MESDPTESVGDSEPAEAEVIEIEVRQLRREPVIDVGHDGLPSVAKSAGEVAMSLMLYSARGGFVIGRALWKRAADSQLGQMISEASAGAAEAISEELGGDLTAAGRATEQRISQVIAAVAPVAARAIDPVELMRYVDIDAVLDQVDTNSILSQVDVDALLGQVDLSALLSRIDLNEILKRVDVAWLISQIDANSLIKSVDLNSVLEAVDVDALLERIDVEALLSNIDVNALISKVDIEAMLDGLDMAAIARQANIGEIVAESTSDVAGTALDLGRRQAVALDTLLARLVNRLLRRASEDMPQGPASLVEAEEPDS